MIYMHIILEQIVGIKYRLHSASYHNLDQVHEVLLIWMVCTSLVDINVNRVLTLTICFISTLTKDFGQLFLNQSLKIKIISEMLNLKSLVQEQIILLFYMKDQCIFLVGMIATIVTMICIKLS